MPLQALKELSLAIPPEPKPAEGFLGLPGEIRNMIYRFTLVEPDRWSRRHKPTCKHCPRKCVVEQPLFTYTTQPCNCIRRTGLDLLLANRQIHAEAAGIFWYENTHCFSNAEQFSKGVRETLRPEYRLHLRHVSIMSWASLKSIEWTGDTDPVVVDWSPSEKQTALVWKTLAECKALERLDLHPYHGDCAKYCGKYHAPLYRLIGEALTSLPLLKSFGWQESDDFYVGNEFNKEWHARKLQMVYSLYRKEEDITTLTSRAAIRKSTRKFNKKFTRHVRYAVGKDLLGCVVRPGTPGVSGHSGSINYYLGKDLIDRNTEHTLRLRDNTDTHVRLFGLPLSVETRKQNAVERFIHIQLAASDAGVACASGREGLGGFVGKTTMEE